MADVILLDGGLGQELIARASGELSPLWSAFVMDHEPEIVRAVHEDYIAAGARVITVNTYAVTRTRLGNYGDAARFEEVQLTACRLADEARGARRDVALAGCLPSIPAKRRNGACWRNPCPCKA